MAAEPAPAKVNLYLHIRGRRADGYHLLESLAVFPGVGDVVTAEPAADFSLVVDGPFAAGLDAGDGNLVLRAARTFGPGPGAALTLSKCLPVASGIGGGSADAAAALRLIARMRGCPVPGGAALALGADVPVCLDPAPRTMTGIGERLAAAPAFPEFWMVLVNPGHAVATGAVFAALAARENPPGRAAPESGFRRFREFASWLAEQRNDLEAPAAAICPAVGEALAALGAAGAPLARMSGSGATCFGLFAEQTGARAAAARIGAARPGWWAVAAPVAANRPAAAR